jgi:hypothetical protein
VPEEKRAFERGVLHLPGLSFIGRIGFPLLPRWATVCRPYRTPSTKQFSIFELRCRPGIWVRSTGLEADFQADADAGWRGSRSSGK